MKKNGNYPYYEVEPFGSIYEMLCLGEKEAGNKTAFKFKKGRNDIAEVKYSEFKKSVDELYSALCVLGFDKEHIACIGENSYKWVQTYLAALVSDGVFVPIDKDLPDNDIINVLCHSDSGIVFCTEKYLKLFEKRKEDLPKIKKIVCFSAESDTDDVLSFDGLFKLGEKNMKVPNTDRDKDKLKLLVYTSGTTGMAKGVMLSEHNLVAGVYHGLRVSTVFTTCLSVLPYHHTYEAVCGLLVSLHKHSCICINESLKAVLPNLSLYRPDYILLVPAFVEVFYNKIQKTIESGNKTAAFKTFMKISGGLRKIGIDARKLIFGSIHKAFGGRLRKIVSGGAPIRPEIGEFFDAIGINLINGYGITECSPLVSANRDYYNNPSTVGVTLPCNKVEIRDKNEDGIGEICVKGETVMLGYYKNEEETKKALIDGWFYTGDYGKFNEEGQLCITGRKKNIIVLRNGKNIYPEEIENYIQNIPEIAEVVVYASKDENGEERGLIAEVYPAEPIERVPLAKKIRDALSGLPSYKQVHQIKIRDTEFEKTTSKKIKRAKYNG